MLHRQPETPPVVSADWVLSRLGEVVLADVRWSLDGSEGRGTYRAGHLPGAVWVDVDRDLAAPPTPRDGRHPLPTPDEFAASMSRLGIPQDVTVVAYDQGHGGYAARLVWMLRVTGHEAALLDGGLATWEGPIDAGEVLRAPTTFQPRPWPRDWLAPLDEVVDLSAALTAGTVTTSIVDARAGERYRGDVEPVDARPGHVPGAINLPFGDNLRADGHFLPVERLRDRFREAGLYEHDDVVVYCGSGVTACQGLLAMELAGIQGRLFPGSWSQWAHRRDLPAEVTPPEEAAGDQGT